MEAPLRVVFGRRRQQEAEAEAAREAERRELFSELAKRPETVCPFLGMADARTQYADGVSDDHRCYAFGDPAELSAEQQLKVCLQRGYGNCPRYLRGVLVIPTEELEALRRPAPLPPAGPPPPPIARPRPAPRVVKAPPRESNVARRVLLVVALLLILGAGGAGLALFLQGQVPSSAVAGALPGGTQLSAELLSLSPSDGDSQELHAVASIGAARQVANTTLIYVLDVSRTTNRTGACGGDQNGDDRENTVLDCEIASAARLNAEAVLSGVVEEVGLVGFADGAVMADVDPQPGAQDRITPNADADGDQLTNVVESMQSAFTGRLADDPVGFEVYTPTTTTSPTTDFSAGIGAACTALATSQSEHRVVVFLSDGLNVSGQPVSEVLPCDSAAVFYSFAIGTEASCAEERDVGGLGTIAELTGGTCTDVPDLNDLPEILQGVVTPQLTQVELTIDGGAPVDVSDAVEPSLPASGPADLTITYQLPALGDGNHELCLIVHGTDAGGQDSLTSCSPSAKSAGGRLTNH